ncbi:MAG: 50S ribosomal protein L19 [Candidatus Krumholzibacteria bacterium]|nr:50S ribosomal protein L19 [Candidatus Krumholzibacteria bacterium]MDP6669882.1 50S ribosomal protein L19 [Candidatus Krumholzibacteria bacterium]MDP6796810.1 50S ribosomal protein L19 [Candidatus Krumholzibacteria bacterium]MDP7021060.1 50S ribosomal protein L19 [Candidatus Krumholzibacteria bacterium]
MNIVDTINSQQMRNEFPDFNVGDTVRFRVRVVEGSKERYQPFQGTVIQRRGSSAAATFTVRKISGGVGVERVFPLHSPSISELEVLSRGKVRRSKLYYLRKLKGKKARISERRDSK